jgi:hypothetical protein
MITKKTKVKQTNRGLRIWIEGQQLPLHGFTCGAAYSIEYNADSIVLTLDATGKRKVTNSRPIIDLTGDAIATVFNAADCLLVEYTTNKITFKRESA